MPAWVPLIYVMTPQFRRYHPSLAGMLWLPSAYRLHCSINRLSAQSFDPPASWTVNARVTVAALQGERDSTIRGGAVEELRAEAAVRVGTLEFTHFYHTFPF